MKDIAEWIFAAAVVLLLRQVWVLFAPTIKIALHRFWRRER